MTSTYIALLRGINVGGRNTLPMKDLITTFADLGCRNSRTYIQSGNVVFEQPSGDIGELTSRLSEAIHGRFGLDVPVVLRSASEWDQITHENPFLRLGAHAKMLHVVFLADVPDPNEAARLDPQCSPGDEFVVRNREIYLRCPNGLARTKLTNAYFDRCLATTSTVRNWNTVLKLRALCGGTE